MNMSQIIKLFTYTFPFSGLATCMVGVQQCVLQVALIITDN